MNLRSFNLYYDYSNSLTLSNASELYLEPNSFQSYASSERERKFRRRSFLSFIKRYFLIGKSKLTAVVVHAATAKNVQKSVLYVQSCCFAPSNYCLFDDLVILLRLADLQGKSETDELSCCVMTPSKYLY